MFQLTWGGLGVSLDRLVSAFQLTGCVWWVFQWTGLFGGQMDWVSVLEWFNGLRGLGCFSGLEGCGYFSELCG